jgi:hypothetical protein
MHLLIAVGTMGISRKVLSCMGLTCLHLQHWSCELMHLLSGDGVLGGSVLIIIWIGMGRSDFNFDFMMDRFGIVGGVVSVIDPPAVPVFINVLTSSAGVRV